MLSLKKFAPPPLFRLHSYIRMISRTYFRNWAVASRTAVTGPFYHTIFRTLLQWLFLNILITHFSSRRLDAQLDKVRLTKEINRNGSKTLCLPTFSRTNFIKFGPVGAYCWSSDHYGEMNSDSKLIRVEYQGNQAAHRAGEGE